MRTSHDLGSCTSRCRRLTTYLTTLPLSTNLRCDCPPTPGSGLGFRNQSPSKMLTNLPKIGHQLTRCVRVGCLLTFRTWRNKEQYRWISIRCNNRLRRCNSNLTPWLVRHLPVRRLTSQRNVTLSVASVFGVVVPTILSNSAAHVTMWMGHFYQRRRAPKVKIVLRRFAGCQRLSVPMSNFQVPLQLPAL